MKILFFSLLFIQITFADNYGLRAVISSTSPDSNWLVRASMVPSGASSKIEGYLISQDGGSYDRKFSFEVDWIPEELFVIDGGKKLVLVNDQRGKGRGENVVVVVSSDGEILKRWTLAEFYLAGDRGKLIKTITSTIWTSGGRWITGNQKLLFKRPVYLRSGNSEVNEYILDVRKMIIEVESSSDFRNLFESSKDGK